METMFCKEASARAGSPQDLGQLAQDVFLLHRFRALGDATRESASLEVNAVNLVCLHPLQDLHADEVLLFAQFTGLLAGAKNLVVQLNVRVNGLLEICSGHLTYARF
jgi:hypothetical protein